MNDNKYYLKIKNKINKLISDQNFKEALKLINEELSMPYIPMDFEAFLIEKIDTLPIVENGDSFSLSIEKIVDLLIKMDESQSDLSDLISQLKKFNLKKEKDELEYYFQKSENKRNRAMIFELLIEEKADIECSLGNPSKSISVKTSDEYRRDLKKLQESLDNYPVLIEPAVKLLNEIYLTKHYGQVLKEEYWDMVIFTLARLFEQEELLELVNDYENLKEKMENFTTFGEI